MSNPNELTTAATRRANGDRLDPKDGPVRVSIHYFKPTSGKWYCDDENVEWRPDAGNYTGWQDFRELHRLKDMTAVCLVSPLGFPQSSPGDLAQWNDNRGVPLPGETVTVKLSQEHYAFLLAKMREFRSGCAAVDAGARQKGGEIVQALVAAVTVED